MTKKNSIDNDVEQIHTASHPTRLEILSRLESEKAYSSKLEEHMKIDRKIISFHLTSLEKAGLVTSNFQLKNEPEERPMAVRYYELTPKGQNILKRLKMALAT
jgi:DNA-binding transcriptional ArsR family regulator